MTFTLALCLQVTSRRLWKVVYNELGGSPGSTSAATCTRRHYEKWVSPITATSPWHCANRPQLARWLWSVWFCSPNRRLMLPYEQQIKGGNQQPSKPKAPVASAASIRKPVRGRIPSAPRKNGVTSQVRAFLKKKNFIRVWRRLYFCKYGHRERFKSAWRIGFLNMICMMQRTRKKSGMDRSTDFIRLEMTEWITYLFDLIVTHLVR